MSEDTRSNMIGAVWFFATITLVALFISAGVQGELTFWHFVLACVILGLTVAATPLLFRWTAQQADGEKSKRPDFDTMLSDMSDEELLELKQRLEMLDPEQTDTLDYVGDDGELVMRS